MSALVAALIVVAFVLAVHQLLRDHYGAAFSASAAVAALLPVYVFACLWPDVLPAHNGAALSLTAHEASSSHYTLVVMTVVALVFTPLVLAYQAWTYWVFRARVGVPAPLQGTGGLADKARSVASRRDEPITHAPDPT